MKGTVFFLFPRRSLILHTFCKKIELVSKKCCFIFLENFVTHWLTQSLKAVFFSGAGKKTALLLTNSIFLQKVCKIKLLLGNKKIRYLSLIYHTFLPQRRNNLGVLLWVAFGSVYSLYVFLLPRTARSFFPRSWNTFEWSPMVS